MITLYDTGPSSFPSHLSCGPYVRKIIFALNYKKLPFKLITLPLPTIESTAKSLGAAPTDTFPTTGLPKYTVPFLQDSNEVVSDSFAIAQYLDTAYPDAPRLFGAETTAAAVKKLIEAREEALKILFPIFMSRIVGLYSDELKAIVASRGLDLNATVPKDEATELWARGKKAFEEVEAHSADVGEGSVYADLALAGMAWHVRCACGEESEEWNEVASWAGGKMGKVTDAAVEYGSQILSA
ncbi:hypothetical protein PQX77_017086 [Marasmius sp. AFHP31]|nr:hypothetical protein PQX77_017086 [Marasmius sp. AFHP31]